MNYKKFIHGYVVQTFNDAGEFLEQRFVASDIVDYEIEEGDPIDETDMPLGGREYFPFEMVQSVE